ncbi:3-phytase [Mucilaginibacter hurinus]|uniref:3-phytase n=1 Tax=Mucilaginibacter hurinus TaxID=2201324 RepID=A0A367GMU6_9SPHI|nr:phytase [Mucilaginibacter hurinus]RCH54013.1 3-phytase [Mucilaginibacter hurinus]
MKKYIAQLTLLSALAGCGYKQQSATAQKPVATDSVGKLVPVVITDTVTHDTDDPAIWINPADASKSLIVGTDKDVNGALYVFDLEGKVVNKVANLKRPNNVDIAYGLLLGGKPVDIAVVTERKTHKLRIFSLPDMKAVDNGGIPVFEGETTADYRDLMGIALYTSPAKEIYAIVGRKTGPTDGTYLWQYLLTDDGSGKVKATLKRKFGKYSGKKEIESIAADNELGYIYYADEGAGVHKYYADPAKGNHELAFFGTRDFAEDVEGISIYKTGAGTGYILVSDQQANKFNVYKREGSAENHNEHTVIASIPFSTLESDGSEVTNVNLNKRFPKGLFVAMTNGKTFHYYDWRDIESRIVSK